MKINWKARLKNKTFLISAAALIISFIYNVLAMFEIVPNISESEIMETLTLVVNILAFMGVIVDPTTEGFNDSDRAMTYYNDEEKDMEEG